MKKKKVIIIVIFVLLIIILSVTIALKKSSNKTENEFVSEYENEIEEPEIDESIKANNTVLKEDIIYTQTKIKNFEYPIINIESEDAKLLNSEIRGHYGFSSESELTGLSEISYDYYLNNNILSVVIKKGGKQSIYANSYNINIETGNIVKCEDIIAMIKTSKNEIKSNILNAVEEEYKKVVEKDRSLIYGQYWDRMRYADKIKESIDEYTKKINGFNNVFLNKKNEVCMIVSFVHPGGEWMCERTIIVNISDNYSVEELKLNNGESSDNTEEIAQNVTTNSLDRYVAEIIEPDYSAYPSTPDAITSDRAIELAKRVFGTKQAENGYEIVYTYYAWGKDESGKEYYIINMQWNKDNELSWVGAVCVAVDGKSYKQLAKQPTIKNGEVITDLLSGGEFQGE